MRRRRWYHKLLHPLLQYYWFLFRPRTYGVRCIVEFGGVLSHDPADLRKAALDISWGSLHQNELPEDAVRREVEEEVGVTLASLVPLGSYFHTRQYKRDTVHCFYGQAKHGALQIDPVEVAEAAWFPIDMLPSPSFPVVGYMLQLYRQYLTKPHGT